MDLLNIKPMTCCKCGARINRSSMKCDYCGTEYESPNKNIKIMVDRPGVHTIRSQTEVDMMYMTHSPESAREYTLNEMRQQIADGLLAYMKMTTSESYNTFKCCQIIRGEVRVLDPSFEY